MMHANTSWQKICVSEGFCKHYLLYYEKIRPEASRKQE